ncbi:hypothetical protein HDU93_002682, partial [Gonapodya sp. JEL0774]
MYTAAAKEILEPISNAVVQLIVINSDAQIAKSPMPDVTEFAGVVRTQVQKLAAIGEEMTAKWDK